MNDALITAPAQLHIPAFRPANVQTTLTWVEYVCVLNLLILAKTTTAIASIQRLAAHEKMSPNVPSTDEGLRLAARQSTLTYERAMSIHLQQADVRRACEFAATSPDFERVCMDVYAVVGEIVEDISFEAFFARVDSDVRREVHYLGGPSDITRDSSPKTSVTHEFARRLRDARSDRTKTEVAKQLDVEPDYYASVEFGIALPSAFDMISWANILDINLDDLISCAS